MLKRDEERIGELVAKLIAADEGSLPVRAMEALIAAGDAAVEPLSVLVEDVANDSYDVHASTLAAIVLGQLRASSAAPALAEAIARSPRDALTFRAPAAEALAGIGAGALPALRSLAASDEWGDRLWAYYAAGLMPAPEAHDFLLGALASDTTLPEAVAYALDDHGNAAAIPALAAALERVEPRQRRVIEQSIRNLHSGSTDREVDLRDWRVRYRVNSLFSRFPLSWVTVMAVVPPWSDTSDGLPVRSLDEILADPRPSDTCDCCGGPQWVGTGIAVCAQDAAWIPAVQAEALTRWRRATGTNDIFEALDQIDAELLEAGAAEEPGSPGAREQRENHVAMLRLVQAALGWAVERGARSISAARALLRTEAVRAARQHGDPDGVVQSLQRGAEPVLYPQWPESD